MDRKARFNRSDAYQVAVGALHAARMVAAYADGRSGPVRMGAETGGLPAWDDLVIEGADGSLEHHQIKRQDGDFSTLKIEDGKPTPLEDTLAALATWVPDDGSVRRSFSLDLRTEGVRIRKELTIAHLETLVSECRKAEPDPDKFAMAADKGLMRDLERWLLSHCQFRDWPHAIDRLKRVRVQHCRGEENIRSDAVIVLEPLLLDTGKAYDAIRTYLLDETGPLHATSPAFLYEYLRPFLRLNRPDWVAWMRTGTAWVTTGTVAPHVPATEVVKRAWQPSARDVRLAVHANAPLAQNRTLLPPSLARLALHAPRPVKSTFDDVALWQERATTWSGGTLGGASDPAPGTHWGPADPAPSSTGGRPVQSGDDEARELSAEMDRVNWIILTGRVEDLIVQEPDEPHRNALLERWERWKTDLDTDPSSRNAWVAALMVAQGEAGRVAGSVRVGPATAHLMADTVLMVLRIVEGSGEPDARWNLISAGRELRTLALKEWSGDPESGGPRPVTRTVRDVLKHETADAVLLAGVEASESDVLGLSIADSQKQGASIAAARRPGLLLTSSYAWNLAVEDGPAAVRTFVAAALAKAAWREQSVEQAVAELEDDK
ncbi:MAG: hypothetical protein Q8P18_21885 [Pseudomonadota bacterium]|nr:hypothetical protein [Pseudomonadota bacterium]